MQVFSLWIIWALTFALPALGEGEEGGGGVEVIVFEFLFVVVCQQFMRSAWKVSALLVNVKRD